VLATGTTIEEWLEGFAISIGLVLDPGIAIVLGIAIGMDNFTEGISIGLRLREENGRDTSALTRRVLGWTGVIGGSLLVAAIVGWFFLRDLSQPVLGFLFAFAGGGLLYLTVTDLLPNSQERQFNQSAAVATGLGFLTILVLSQVM
jgi:zinc transporter, ZIP family